MRNKKIFTISLLTIVFLFGLDKIFAKSYEELAEETFVVTSETTKYEDPVCQNGEAAGDYTLKWNEQRIIMGAVFAHYQSYTTETKTPENPGPFNTRDEAQSAADDFLDWTPPSCCSSDDPKDGGCRGSSACNPPSCGILTNTRASGTCSCGYRGTGGVVTGGENVNCSLNNGVASCPCPEGKSYLGGNCSTTYTYSLNNCTKNELKPSGKYFDGERNLYTYYYTMKIANSVYSGDEVYCVQPGAHGPGKNGKPYVLDTDYDISECRDQYTRFNKNTGKYERATQCGLAHIMFEAYNYDETTRKFTTMKGTYSPEALTLALRLWLAAYGLGTEGIGLGNEGAEESIIGFVPRENYYTVTAGLIKNGGTYDTSNGAIVRDKVEGRIGCSDKESASARNSHRCVIDQAIELFHRTEKIKQEEFLGGININRKVPTATYEVGSGKIKITFDDPSTMRIVKEKCQNPYDPGCILEPHFYMYKDGQYIEVTDIVLKPDGANFCNKNTCDFIPEGIREKCLLGGTAIKLVLVLKTWYQDTGYLNFYVHASEPTNYQVMVSIGRLIEDCYQHGTTIKRGRIEVEIPCSCEDKCTDLSYMITNAKEGVCNPKKTISDPSMNCITNACDPKMVADYDVTSDYDVDSLVCSIYEREDNEINMPEAVSTYSGMQFSYDIGKKLGSRSDKKLTSVIVQKRQLTSKINYEYWKKEYDKKVDLLKKAYGLSPYSSSDANNYSDEYRNTIKKDISNWVYALRNCNLAGKVNASDSRVYAVNQMDAMINDIVNCTGLGCKSANLELSYDDSRYGQKRTLAVERNLLGSEMYYCHGNNCYKYNGSTTYTEPKMSNSTERLTYYNCSGRSCSTATITVPNNTFATKVYNIEHDYYNNKKYSAQAYTGTALEEGAVTASDTSTPLADYVYPISGSLKTNLSDGENSYGVNFHYTNITNKKLKDFSTSEKCLFKVYNRTTAYDCKITDSKGNVDLSKCRDTKYEVTNGVPKIDENNQIEWVLTNKKQYGYVFRNIDLANPFPNKLKNRTSVINWTEADIKAIQDTAEKIFTNGDYLDYSYTLTTQTIKQIKAYNDRQKKSGGYLNNTLEKCTITKDDTGLSIFTECRSNFLHGELRDYVGIQIGGKKAGVN